jgi:hypothetical protein
MKMILRQLRAMKVAQCLLAVLRVKGKYNNDGLNRKNIPSVLKKFKQKLKKIFPEDDFPNCWNPGKIKYSSRSTSGHFTE